MIDVKAIQDSAVRAAGAQARLLATDREPGHVYFEVSETGALVRREAQPKPRKYIARTLEEFIDAVVGFRDVLHPGDGDELDKGAVLAAVPGVIYFHDEATRRDSIGLHFAESSSWTQLEAAENNDATYDQAAFIRWLKVDMAGCVDAGFIQLLRSINFVSNDDNTSVVDPNRTTVNKQLMRKVIGAGDLPEEVTLVVPPFENLWTPSDLDGPLLFKVPIRCRLDVSMENCTFSLTPLAGELSRGLHMANEYVVNRLRALDGVVVLPVSG